MLNRYAQTKFHGFNDTHRKYVYGKSEKCRKQYRDIIADSDKVSKHNFTLPETINVKIDQDGREFDNHLFADEQGIARIKLNGWEEGVLAEEAKRDDFVCWLQPEGKMVVVHSLRSVVSEVCLSRFPNREAIETGLYNRYTRAP